MSSDIRAFFITFYEKQDGTIIILDVTTRQNAYDNKNLKIYDKQANEVAKTKQSSFNKR